MWYKLSMTAGPSSCLSNLNIFESGNISIKRKGISQIAFECSSPFVISLPFFFARRKQLPLKVECKTLFLALPKHISMIVFFICYVIFQYQLVHCMIPGWVGSPSWLIHIVRL